MNDVIREVRRSSVLTVRQAMEFLLFTFALLSAALHLYEYANSQRNGKVLQAFLDTARFATSLSQKTFGDQSVGTAVYHNA